MSKLLAVRLPEELIEGLKDIRRKNGTVIAHFVAEAISDKIREMKEMETDSAIIASRVAEDTFSEKEWKKTLKHKGLKA